VRDTEQALAELAAIVEPGGQGGGLRAIANLRFLAAKPETSISSLTWMA
jgi:hypothetical protein